MEIKTCEQYVLDQLEQARAERDWLREKLEQAQDEAEELRGKLMERGEHDASKVEQATVSSTATAPATARAWTTATSLFRSLTGASSTSATQACAAA